MSWIRPTKNIRISYIYFLILSSLYFYLFDRLYIDDTKKNFVKFNANIAAIDVKKISKSEKKLQILVWFFARTI